MSWRPRPPSVGSTMFTNTGCALVVAVLGLGALAHWGWTSGRTWVMVVAGLLAPMLVVFLNHAGPPKGRS